MARENLEVKETRAEINNLRALRLAFTEVKMGRDGSVRRLKWGPNADRGHQEFASASPRYNRRLRRGRGAENKNLRALRLAIIED